MTIQTFADKHRLRTRIDTDGTKIIPGRVGHIYEYDDDLLGVMVMPDPPRVQYWGFARRNLKAVGCTVVQNGDGEGAATFDPENKQQAKLAIKVARIKRKRIMSEAQLDQLRRARESSPLVATAHPKP